MEGPSATIALVLAETAAGGAALLWLGGLWGSVKRGFFILTGASVLALCLMATLSAASAATSPVSSEARLAVYTAAGSSVLLSLSLVALLLRLDRIGRLLGFLSISAVTAMLVCLARVSSSFVPSLVQLLAGAAFMGAVIDGLLLGHWYLTDRRLARGHIRRFSVVLLFAVAIEATALAVLGFGANAADEGGFSVILGVSGLRTWLALGMVGCTGLIAFLIKASLRGESPRAVQGATGFFYLAVITAFTGEMAAKVGFLG
ncbi:MAG: hypothetical protein ACRDH9_06070 [Actinomycetota bacterium]